ncbi:MAG TPA: helix-hairpin-helix domain-containing protein [Candidatus Acidoferrum sp.]|nr:helix-hairpin-helix domain-containing protein [Candidatus Acidoferrum sp.]
MSWNFPTLPRMPLTCLSILALSLAASIAVANKKPPERPVNLNTATAEELEQVPGIGPVTAEKILKMRKAYGPFKSVDDLRAIRGIGPKRLEKMRKYLTVAKPAPRAKPASAARPASTKPAKRAPTVQPSAPVDPPRFLM